jgi:ABC-2 type transport system permease protein
MRFMAYTRKTLLETVRDWKLLLFTLFFAPCFVFILYGAYGGGSPSFHVAVFNQDVAGGSGHGAAVARQLEQATYKDGSPLFKVRYPERDGGSLEDALKRVEKRSLDAVLVLPESLSTVMDQAAAGESYTGVPYKLYGDPRNSKYTLAAIYLITEVEAYMHAAAPAKLPLTLQEELIGDGPALTDFDLYIPGLLVMAFLNILFTAGASFIKETEKGTITRLYLSRLRVREMIGSISLVQLVLGMASFVLTLAAARICGYTWKGQADSVLLVALVSVIGVLGLTLVAVSFMRSVFDVMTIGMVPYFLVMFFAGIFFPLPSVELFSIAGTAFRASDLLPLSLSVSALNQALNFGSGIREISLEVMYNLLVACGYFMMGLCLFRRKHMKLG